MELTQMKKWNRWIGACAVSSTFVLAQSVTLAQQGYNSSAAPLNQTRANPSANNQVQQPLAQQPLVQQSRGNPAATGQPVAASNAQNLAQPTAQLSSQSGQPGGMNATVTRDPYADNPLTAQEQQDLDKLLAYWEYSTKDIERLSCTFRKFEYNSNANFVQQLAQQTSTPITSIHTSASSGVVKFSKPDKGMYKIDEMVVLSGKLDSKNQIERIRPANVMGEHWICDGNTVHNYDHAEKVVTRYSIPSNMQGVGILESPMPFLLGVEANKLKERYWLRPKGGTKQQDGTVLYAIEAYPKTQQDAVNYSHVLVYLDSKEFLPLHLIVYKTEHSEAPESWVDARDHYEFTSREKNASVLTKLTEALFMKEFIPMKVGSDWKEEHRTYAPPGSTDAASTQGILAQPTQQPGQQVNQPGGFAPQQGAQPQGMQPQGAPNNQAIPVRANPNQVPANVPNAANRAGGNNLGTR